MLFVDMFRHNALNILLTVPFGFLFPILKQVKPRSIGMLALCAGLATETIQLLIALLFENQYRIIHSDDVLMNAGGVLIGYMLLQAVRKAFLIVIKKEPIKSPPPIP